MKSVLRVCAVVAAVVSLTACTVRNPVKENSPDAEVVAAQYVHDGPPRLTLFTMRSNRTGQGAHTSLLINASERVAFDPAGSFRKEGAIVAKNDVVYGMTPWMVDQYTRFHARETYHVVVQSIDVSPQVAEMALRKAKTLGPVLEAQCAQTTSQVLRSLPGFEDAPSTFFPTRLEEYFAAKGATYDRLFEYDDDDKSKVLAAFTPEYEAEPVDPSN
ncbi:hypothetical protein BXY66_0520 [Shimia isoporae]|uniref:Lipoprotein n=1 Tax=Shimia isoporae TaxID=647720 RepID=A0A4R1NPC2_9RHOB|nr:hypothetical protein [Shimia isoporae]TCL08483.1 hypothetical protein BXY66_0520 [Shimia isoporae]